MNTKSEYKLLLLTWVGVRSASDFSNLHNRHIRPMLIFFYILKLFHLILAKPHFLWSVFLHRYAMSFQVYPCKVSSLQCNSSWLLSDLLNFWKAISSAAPGFTKNLRLTMFSMTWAVGQSTLHNNSSRVIQSEYVSEDFNALVLFNKGK